MIPIEPIPNNGRRGSTALPVGIGGGEVGFALRASHSGDKGDGGDGGVNTSMVIEKVKDGNIGAESAQYKYAQHSCEPQHRPTEVAAVAATLRACSSTEKGHSARAGDKDENLIAEVSPTLRGHVRNNSNPGTEAEMLICADVTTLDAKHNIDRGDSQHLDRLIAHSLRGDGFDASEDGPHNGGGQNGQDAYTSRIFMSVRRLTPRECERLMGFPDDFTAIIYRGKPASDGPRYKALGNSMVTFCIEWIGGRIATVDGLGSRVEGGIEDPVAPLHPKAPSLPEHSKSASLGTHHPSLVTIT